MQNEEVPWSEKKVRSLVSSFIKSSQGCGNYENDFEERIVGLETKMKNSNSNLVICNIYGSNDYR